MVSHILSMYENSFLGRSGRILDCGEEEHGFEPFLGSGLSFDTYKEGIKSPILIIVLTFELY